MLHRVRGLGRRVAAVVGTVVLLPFVLSGCTATATAAHRGPASEAQQVLQHVEVPSGAVRLTSGAAAPAPFQSADLGCGDLVEKAAYWRLSKESVTAVQDWLEHHVPSGFQTVGTGSGGGRGGRTMTEVDLAVRRADLAPEGSRLVLMVVSSGSGAILRASSQIVPASGCRSVHRYPALRGGATASSS